MNPLVCSVCAGDLLVVVEQEFGFGVRVDIECSQPSCGAIWDGAGQPVRTPAQFRAEVDALARTYRK